MTKMTNEEAIEKLKELLFMTGYNEALNLAIQALEFQAKFIDIFAQVVVDAGCDSLEEFCEKCGIEVKEDGR